MSGTFDENGGIDASGRLLVFLGKKKSGKSKLALLWLQQYPGDKLIIDVNRTDGPIGPDVIDIEGRVGDLPDKWPEDLRKFGPDDKPLPMTIRFLPDAGSNTPRTNGQPGGMIADIDHMLGLAWVKGKVCILIHETGIVARSNRVGRNMLRICQSNRHREITGLFCAPRALTMEPLVVGQGDVVYVFYLPNRHDQKRVAELVGWDADEFSEAVNDLRQYEYLRVDTNENQPDTDGEPDLRIVHFEPLPEIVIRQLKASTPSDV